MAPNKRKILEAARKHAQKGAKDRALKEYEKLLKLKEEDKREEFNKLLIEVLADTRRYFTRGLRVALADATTADATTTAANRIMVVPQCLKTIKFLW